MTQEDYISYETAKLLKEKGFTLPVKNYYSLYTEDVKHNLQRKYGAKKNWNSFAFAVSRPSQSLVMKWLREVHHLHISIEMGFDVDNHQYYFFVPSICKFSSKTGEYQTPFDEREFDSYKEACEAAIKYCLENLI